MDKWREVNSAAFSMEAQKELVYLQVKVRSGISPAILHVVLTDQASDGHVTKAIHAEVSPLDL
jgi:hypothetical protein